ncbi:REP-associated tyrosine transposase [Stenotrophomonas oahuensis]|uniref:Transposase n=1 Tax=Stenotrophomonas oahuensis TaxID=3003271 RepID=A0ABY9YRM3_9GAMM|nr:transposase [Stenotrophomonas sp. A5586]WNH53362.1 transposase [Stenotrophomonas sp. A5586]
MSSSSLQRGRQSAIGGIYILTTVVHCRRPLFEHSRNAEIVIETLRHMERSGRSRTYAWVVMPDHVHWVMELKSGTLAGCMNLFKSRSSRLMGAGRVWQSGYHDHALRKEESLEHVARYIVGNPIRAGLTRNAGEYPYAWCCGAL